MGEYYLSCEPKQTTENMKDVIKIIDNPIFNKSIISNTNMYFKVIIILILLCGMYYFYMIIYNSYNSKIKENYDEIKIFGSALLLLICFIFIFIFAFNVITIN